MLSRKKWSVGGRKQLKLLLRNHSITVLGFLVISRRLYSGYMQIHCPGPSVRTFTVVFGTVVAKRLL